MNEIIINLIKEIRPYEEIGENTELVESGLLDSLSIIRLITQLEELFCIEIPDDEVTADNFRTIRDIAQLVNINKK